jgi:hypothetical protein
MWLIITSISGYGNKVRQSAERFFGLIGHFAPAIQRVLLLDYVDEVLDSLITPQSSPQSIACFVTRCMPL